MAGRRARPLPGLDTFQHPDLRVLSQSFLDYAKDLEARATGDEEPPKLLAAPPSPKHQPPPQTKVLRATAPSFQPGSAAPRTSISTVLTAPRPRQLLEKSDASSWATKIRGRTQTFSTPSLSQSATTYSSVLKTKPPKQHLVRPCTNTTIVKQKIPEKRPEKPSPKATILTPPSPPKPLVESSTPVAELTLPPSNMAIPNGKQANQSLPRQQGTASPFSLELPKLPGPKKQYLNIDAALLDASAMKFNIETVCAALQEGCSTEALFRYLGSYDASYIQQEMTQKIKRRCTALFYAIEHGLKQDNVDSIKLLLEYGANPNEHFTTVNPPCGIPALGYAMMRGMQLLKSTLLIVKTLLSAGAQTALNPIGDEAACASWTERCHRAIDVSEAYFIQRRQNGNPFPSGIKKQLASIHGLWGLLNIDNYLVGQDHAVELVKEALFAYFSYATKEVRPHVMAFSGPSGHGKTEMASQMGQLLSLDTTTVDCAHMKHDTDLFGSRNGYKRSEEGSQLNNFLAKHNGERAVIFLDEFDKTPQEIRHSLLLICDSGTYYDRRNNKPIDCSRTIWIMATNLGDEAIKRFFKQKVENSLAKPTPGLPIEPLQDDILEKFRDTFGAPLTARIDVVAPFLPFDDVEQAIVAHGLLVQLVNELRQPLDCRPHVNRYIGHTFLDIGDGMEVSEYIARTSYNPEFGARSLKRGIEELKRKFVTAYCDAHPSEVTEEINNGPLWHFRVQLRRKVDGKQELTVTYQGLTTVTPEITPAVSPVEQRLDYQHYVDFDSDSDSSIASI